MATSKIKPTVQGSLIVEERIANEVTYGANSANYATFDLTKQGYQFIGCVGFDTYNAGLVPISMPHLDSTSQAWFRNVTNSSIKSKVRIRALFMYVG